MASGRAGTTLNPKRYLVVPGDPLPVSQFPPRRLLSLSHPTHLFPKLKAHKAKRCKGLLVLF